VGAWWEGQIPLKLRNGFLSGVEQVSIAQNRFDPYPLVIPQSLWAVTHAEKGHLQVDSLTAPVRDGCVLCVEYDTDALTFPPDWLKEVLHIRAVINYFSASIRGEANRQNIDDLANFKIDLQTLLDVHSRALPRGLKALA
jgi:hypothetical protein